LEKQNAPVVVAVGVCWSGDDEARVAREGGAGNGGVNDSCDGEKAHQKFRVMLQLS